MRSALQHAAGRARRRAASTAPAAKGSPSSSASSTTSRGSTSRRPRAKTAPPLNTPGLAGDEVARCGGRRGEERLGGDVAPRRVLVERRARRSRRSSIAGQHQATRLGRQRDGAASSASAPTRGGSSGKSVRSWAPRDSSRASAASRRGGRARAGCGPRRLGDGGAVDAPAWRGSRVPRARPSRVALEADELPHEVLQRRRECAVRLDGARRRGRSDGRGPTASGAGERAVRTGVGRMPRPPAHRAARHANTATRAASSRRGGSRRARPCRRPRRPRTGRAARCGRTRRCGRRPSSSAPPGSPGSARRAQSKPCSRHTCVIVGEALREDSSPPSAVASSSTGRPPWRAIAAAIAAGDDVARGELAVRMHVEHESASRARRAARRPRRAPPRRRAGCPAVASAVGWNW